MVRQSHRFLLSFLAAYRTHRPYLVVAHSKAALQLLAIFRHYGLVRSYQPLRGPLGTALSPGVFKGDQPRYLLVWLQPHPSQPTAENQQRWSVGGRGRQNAHRRGSHQLLLLQRPSQRHRQRLSYRQLVTLRPHLNTLYLLQTSRGVVTHPEALRFRLGGTLLAKLVL